MWRVLVQELLFVANALFLLSEFAQTILTEAEVMVQSL